MGKEYKYKVGEIVNETLRIVEQIRVSNGKNKTQKGYVIQSLIYPEAELFEKPEAKLNRGDGCPYSSGNRICLESSLWSVESIRGNIIDIEEAKTISRSSDNPILFKCDTEGCDTVKAMYAQNLISQGFSCPNCSKGYYPEYYTQAYLTVKNIPHETQVKYDDLGNRRYDFRIKLNGVTFLLETHGEQHFLTEDKGYHKVETIQESDAIKRQYAKDNNINYIELDCRESEFEFIRQQIKLNEHLPNITDDEVDAMLEIMELSSKYPVKEIVETYKITRKTLKELGEMYNIKTTTVWNILHRQNVKLEYDRTRGKMVRCVETGTVYKSSVAAADDIGLKSSGKVLECAKGKRKTAGGYTWEFLTEIEANAYHRATNYPCNDINLDENFTF